MIEAYHQCFASGAVLWRTTNRPNEALSYRFYSRSPIDTVSIAISADFIKPSNPLVHLIQRWSEPWAGPTPEQSCDFDSEKGLSKIWVTFGAFRQLDDLLSVEGVPDSVRQHKHVFHSLGLELLRNVAVDFQSDTVNLYLRVSGALTEEKAASLVALADGSTLTPSMWTEMQRYLSPSGCTLATTILAATGEIKRVAIYALGLPPDSFPDIGDKLKTFFEVAPSYDSNEFTAVGWSFGAGGRNYLKAEKSYCGELYPLLRSHKSLLVSDEKFKGQ